MQNLTFLNSFNLYVNDTLCYQNENIYFTCNFIKKYQDSEFIQILQNMDVCTFLYFENGLKIFKN